YSVLAHHAAGSATVSLLPDIPPSSQSKCAVDVEVPAEVEGDALEIRLELVDPEGQVVHVSTLDLAVRDAHGKHARTFVSAIDGSVQYFAVTPPTSPADGERPAMILTLHGAGVEGRGQANSYAPKDWAVIIAPTNRRPYGFDWEDWGRLDAMEVLSIAEELYDTDPRRTYLTGHSMGGHGTWQIGVQFPGRFAAIAPSAGWSDFWSYAGGGTFSEDDPLGPLFTRAVNVSRTRLLERNLLHGGVYVLHGDADDNVPVREARAMRARLADFHPNFAYYERPGAGHWWGGACVDWPPLMAFLRENRLPDPTTVFDVEFTTVDPGVSDRCYWVSIEAQEHWLEPSRVRARLNAAERSIALELTNVTRVTFDLSAFALPQGEREPALAAGSALHVELDGSQIELSFETAHTRVGLQRAGDGTWHPVGDTPSWNKGPHRAGAFKNAFRHRPVLVYGTAGSPQENAWSFAKARYDHETWRYRGNGLFAVVADVDFRPTDYEDRSVVLYGNRDTNAAWSVLLESKAFDLSREFVRVGDHTLEGDDLALLAIYPRRDSHLASVAVVGGTGLAGCRTTDHLPYFVSGVAYPDWTVFGVDFLTEGLEGVRGAGYFSGDWSAEEGAEAVWR
ncbi:MAG: prolyl oligopeptidase family serine peptidase, partial [Planctomycetota bacterium]